MADPAGLQYADLARQRAEAAALAKAAAQAAQKRAEQAAADAEDLRAQAARALADVNAAAERVRGLREEARQDAQQASDVLAAANQLHATLAAGTIPYNDAETELGANTVAGAIAILAELARSAGGGQAGKLDFQDPNQSGLFPAL